MERSRSSSKNSGVKMKTKWSVNWRSSAQPRKQRKYRHNAPMHVKQKFLAVHLDSKLRKRIGKRSMQVKKGDEVKVLRGSKKGVKAKVVAVSLKKGIVHLEGQTREKVAGTKVAIPFRPSNLLITELKLDDKYRGKRLKSIKALKAEQKPKPSIESKESEKEVEAKSKTSEAEKPEVNKK